MHNTEIDTYVPLAERLRAAMGQPHEGCREYSIVHLAGVTTETVTTRATPLDDAALNAALGLRECASYVDADGDTVRVYRGPSVAAQVDAAVPEVSAKVAAPQPEVITEGGHRVHRLPAGQLKVPVPKVLEPVKPPHVGRQLDGTLDGADDTVVEMLPTGKAIRRAHEVIAALGIHLKLDTAFTRRFEREARKLEGEGLVVVERPGRKSGEPNRFSERAVELVARAIAARC